MNVYDYSYDGMYHQYFWDIKINPNADVQNCLPDCTTFVYGLCRIDGYKPVKSIVSANQWHLYLSDDMSYIDFKYDLVKVGDILEWVNGCHVARVSKIENGKIFVYASWYTGIHGKSMIDGKYDTRPFNTTKEVNDFMLSHYPYRFAHECTLDEENAGIGYQPKYILKRNPVILPVERNENVDQIYVKTNVQNVRDNDNNIVGVASQGYYNVLQTKTNNSSPYTWYEVYENKYIAGVSGRVEFIEGTDEKKELKKYVAKLEKENAELKERLRQIHNLSGD